LHYTFDDPGPYTGISYYRLRQTNLDGTSTLSRVVPVWFDAEAATVLVYPNPNNGAFTVVRNAAPADLPLELVDAAGRVVQHVLLSPGSERAEVSMDGAPGLYTLRWPDGQVRVSVVR
jgi:hypothetical protein